MTVKQYDCVLLKDGREGAIVEILGDHEVYLVDIGSSPKDWETIEIKPDEIEKVIYCSKD